MKLQKFPKYSKVSPSVRGQLDHESMESRSRNAEFNKILFKLKTTENLIASSFAASQQWRPKLYGFTVLHQKSWLNYHIPAQCGQRGSIFVRSHKTHQLEFVLLQTLPCVTHKEMPECIAP